MTVLKRDVKRVIYILFFDWNIHSFNDQVWLHIWGNYETEQLSTYNAVYNSIFKTVDGYCRNTQFVHKDLGRVNKIVLNKFNSEVEKSIKNKHVTDGD